MQWVTHTFDSLSASELYELLRLRSRVFHLEQNCAYVDTDNKDQHSIHILGYEEGKLIAYARILPPGLSFKEISIGRVVTDPDLRGRGLGKDLMKICLEHIQKTHGSIPVRICAQCYLKKFYSAFGFVEEGEEFLEDNIPHIEMLKQP